jgi:hypothetical protein
MDNLMNTTFSEAQAAAVQKLLDDFQKVEHNAVFHVKCQMKMEHVQIIYWLLNGVNHRDLNILIAVDDSKGKGDISELVVYATDNEARLKEMTKKSKELGGQVNRVCDNCHKIAKCQKCGKCKKALYCSSECQKADWKASHKAKCTN